ncbi:hypothetical protein GDO81_027764 [Engystomops pustulosus]|uniref:Uncharacterized protein n=1 Tax=Engystomops pustulosus TaxID=76066 RepID=A0AAV6YE23_ENGPU|nr:hypothetical protein GDO81_027764 [Engystomops pustulosus]
MASPGGGGLLFRGWRCAAVTSLGSDSSHYPLSRVPDFRPYIIHKEKEAETICDRLLVVSSADKRRRRPREDLSGDF